MMTSWDTADRIALIKQISALECRLMDVEWKAKWAFDAEQQRTRNSLAFWTFLYKTTAIATMIVAWGLLLFDTR